MVAKFSWWAGPMFVITPMVGWMMARSACISSGLEMPASKMPTCECSVSCHTLSGTPTCEL